MLQEKLIAVFFFLIPVGQHIPKLCCIEVLEGLLADRRKGRHIACCGVCLSMQEFPCHKLSSSSLYLSPVLFAIPILLCSPFFWRWGRGEGLAFVFPLLYFVMEPGAQLHKKGELENLCNKASRDRKADKAEKRQRRRKGLSV